MKIIKKNLPLLPAFATIIILQASFAFSTENPISNAFSSFATTLTSLMTGPIGDLMAITKAIGDGRHGRGHRRAAGLVAAVAAHGILATAANFGLLVGVLTSIR